MKRTTISLPDDVAFALEREAKRRGESISAVTREALAERFGLRGTARRELPFAKLGRSGRRDIGERVDEVIAEEWRPDRDR
jgi:predicted transcriptional regulator